MDLNYQLTPQDVRMDLLTKEEKQVLKGRLRNRDYKNKTWAEGLQRMCWEALAVTIPREKNEPKTGTDRKPVILQAEDVSSFMLTDQEKKILEKDYKAAMDAQVEFLGKPALVTYHEEMEKLYDEVARQAGFAQFDENQEGTGLRNYTAKGKTKTPAVREKIKIFNELFEKNPEVKAVREKFHALNEKVNRINNEIGQVYLRNILAITNERRMRYDAMGEEILSAEEYLKARENWTPEERQIKERPYTRPVSVGANGVYKNVQVDYSIAPLISDLTAAGYVTGPCCSGLLADYPNNRHQKDDKNHRFAKGECVCYNKQGSRAYLTFYKPETGLNDDRMMENVKNIATQQGWIVEDRVMFGKPFVQLELPYTYDGMSVRDLLKEANHFMNLCLLIPDRNSQEWFDKRDEVLLEKENQHGGIVRWTDAMIGDRWKKLTAALCEARFREKNLEQEQLNRITDVRVFYGGDGNLRIKCRIDGQGTLSERLEDNDRKQVAYGKDIRKVAARYYQSELNAGQEQQKTVKR